MRPLREVTFGQLTAKVTTAHGSEGRKHQLIRLSLRKLRLQVPKRRSKILLDGMCVRLVVKGMPSKPSDAITVLPLGKQFAGHLHEGPLSPVPREP